MKCVKIDLKKSFLGQTNLWTSTHLGTCYLNPENMQNCGGSEAMRAPPIVEGNGKLAIHKMPPPLNYLGSPINKDPHSKNTISK